MTHPSSPHFQQKLTALPQESIDLLLEQGQPRNWAKGALLLKEGEKCKDIHFIDSGLVRAFQDKEGKDINLDFYFEADFVTTLKSLRAGEPSAYNRQAMEPVRTISFRADSLLALYQRSPDIESWGRQLLESLLLRQQEQSSLFRLHSPEERYQHILTHYPKIIQRIPLGHLASWLGITRESLSRIRSRIK